MKKSIFRALAIALTAALLCALLPMLAGAEEPAGELAVDITQDFTDPKFRARVYVLLGRADTEAIYGSDVAEIEELWVGTRGIESLAGLQHFTGLRILGCYANELTALPALPAGLEELYCANNRLAALPALPAGLTHLSVHDNLLTELPALPEGLEILWCGGNLLTALPRLPSTLTRLYCEKNQLTGVDISGLPDLEYIECTYNEMVGVTDIGGFLGKLTMLFDNKAFRFYPQSQGFWAPWNEWLLLVLEFVLFGWAWMRLFRLFWA